MRLNKSIQTISEEHTTYAQKYNNYTTDISSGIKFTRIMDYSLCNIFMWKRLQEFKNVRRL